MIKIEGFTTARRDLACAIRGVAISTFEVGTVTPPIDVAQVGEGRYRVITERELAQLGRALEEHGSLWLEEPLSDRDRAGLRRLCREMTVLVLGAGDAHARP